jgi:branched-chain amino acid transport system ATP-binding protein
MRQDGASSAALELSGLRLAYGDVTAVWDASLTLSSGRITALLGRNGAGKTTLLAGAMGLLKPVEGSVRLHGRDITRLSTWDRVAGGLGVVLEGKRVFRNLSVDDNLRLGAPKKRNTRRSVARSEIPAIYDRFPLLAQRRDHSAGSLSGGQQQLLAIATALISRPTVLLIDEPSSGLAPLVVDEVLQVVKELRDLGIAILLVEQLVDRVLDGVADDVALIEHGHIIRTGPASEFTLADVGAAFGMQ